MADSQQLLHMVGGNAKEIWGYIGPLVGLYAGNYLTKSSQRKQWLLDRRREEFREVVSAMTHATVELQAYMASKTSSTPQPFTEWLGAFKDAGKILADRIFIANDLNEADIPTRYMDAAAKLMESGDPESEETHSIEAIIREVVEMAKKG